MIRRTKIWIETERAFVQSKGLRQKQWCALCTSPSIMLTLEEAVSFLGEDKHSIQRLTQSGTVHFMHDPLGELLICVHTLWAAQLNNPNGSPLHANDAS